LVFVGCNSVIHTPLHHQCKELFSYYQVLQLLKIMDDWTYNLDQGKQIDVIYTDLEKAFDKVPHAGLIKKLKEYKINTNLILWTEAFLSNRKQRVKVHDSYSKWCLVESDIPQGSILGPILFLIYTI